MVAFKTISLIPTLIWISTTTVFIALSVILHVSAHLIGNRFPQISMSMKTRRTHGSNAGIVSVPTKKTLDRLFPVLGIALIVTGSNLAIWISRPYITLLLSTSKVDALEQRVRAGQVQGNRIIIPSALVDAPILEGVSPAQLSRGVCHVATSAVPHMGGNCILEGHNLAEFGWWKPQSFFSMLEVIDIGTPIYIFINGRKYTYKVMEKTYCNVDDPKLYDNTPGDRLTLVTCVSTWSPTIYTNRRTVVVAVPA